MTYKKITLPREKNCDVSSFSLKKSEPRIRACTVNVLSGISTEYQLSSSDDNAYMRLINSVAMWPRRICRRRSMTARACIGIDIVYGLPLVSVVACSSTALCLYARARSGWSTNSFKYVSMSIRFAAFASEAKNADANSAAVCGTDPLKSLRTVRARGFVTNARKIR